MAANSKVNVSYEVEEDQQEWLEEMATQYKLPDASKALRVVLDFAVEYPDATDIFEQIRCRHCG
ncbi:MAG: hypothetical protein AAF492_12195 [Verrucomicrobiota bacterium]